MIDSIFQSIEKLVIDLSWRRVTVYVGTIALVVITLMAYEAYTKGYLLERYENTIDLLIKIQPLLQSDNEDVRRIAVNLINEISFLNSNIEAGKAKFSYSSLWQAIAGAGPWLLMLLIYAPLAVRKKEEDWQYGVIGIVVIALLVGTIAYAVPDDLSAWIRYGAVQVVNVLIFSIMAYLGNKD